MDLVYFRPQHPEGIAFAIALCGNPDKWHDKDGLDIRPCTLNDWPDVNDCKGRHVVIEHHMPTQSYLVSLAQVAKTVTLWLLEPLHYEMPSNVTVRSSSENVPEYLQVEDSAWTNRLFMEKENSPLWLWLWYVSAANSSCKLTVQRSYANKFHEAYNLIRSGQAYTEGEMYRKTCIAHIESQMEMAGAFRLCGMTGVSLNLPYHLLRYTAYLIKDTPLLLLYTIRKGTVVGFMRVPLYLHKAVSEQLFAQYGVKLTSKMIDKDCYVLKTSIGRIAKLHARSTSVKEQP